MCKMYVININFSAQSLDKNFEQVCVCLQQPCDENYPKFAQVVHVVVAEELQMLLLRTFTTDSYSQHHNAYCVTKTSDYVVVAVHEQALHFGIHFFYCN